MLILVCNAGSTSLKYKLFNMPDDRILVEGKVERVGRDDAIFSYVNYAGKIASAGMTGRNASVPGNVYPADATAGPPNAPDTSDAPDTPASGCLPYRIRMENLPVPDYTAGIRLFLKYLLDEEAGYLRDLSELQAVGFKTVLAKGYYGVHELTEDVIRGMEAYISVAPAHNPPYIRAVREFKALLPDKLMVGCFETAFHTTVPPERSTYAIPWEWTEKYGIKRYGYHGASHGYIARQIRQRAGEHFRLISCHMGGSGSICAVLDGKSVDTSFGFSLQTGIPHANRCGDMDAYIIPFLLGQGLSIEEITSGIDKKGGLLGISGVSNDLREIEAAAAAGNARAELAIDVFCNSALKYIGAFYAELGGLDYLVFTGGIGENSVTVREKICGKLAHLGIDFDPERNRTAKGECVLSREGSPVQVLVLPTNEEVGIAQTIFEQFGEQFGEQENI